MSTSSACRLAVLFPPQATRMSSAERPLPGADLLLPPSRQSALSSRIHADHGACGSNRVLDRMMSVRLVHQGRALGDSEGVEVSPSARRPCFSQLYAVEAVESNSAAVSCDCLAHTSTLGFDAGRVPPTPPVCYRASWQLPGPDFHRQATTSLRLRINSRTKTPSLLGARNIDGYRRGIGAADAGHLPFYERSTSGLCVRCVPSPKVLER
jgi:hypothetical protein